MYSLAGYAYCCEFPDGAVILDLRTDAYLAVNAELLPPLRRKVRNWPTRETAPAVPPSYNEVDFEAVVVSLVSRGVLVASPTPFRVEHGSIASVTAAVRATCNFAEGFRIVDIWRFLSSLLTVVYLQRTGLVPLVEWLR